MIKNNEERKQWNNAQSSPGICTITETVISEDGSFFQTQKGLAGCSQQVVQVRHHVVGLSPTSQLQRRISLSHFSLLMFLYEQLVLTVGGILDEVAVMVSSL